MAEEAVFQVDQLFLVVPGGTAWTCLSRPFSSFSSTKSFSAQDSLRAILLSISKSLLTGLVIKKIQFLHSTSNIYLQSSVPDFEILRFELEHGLRKRKWPFVLGDEWSIMCVHVRMFMKN